VDRWNQNKYREKQNRNHKHSWLSENPCLEAELRAGFG